MQVTNKGCEIGGSSWNPVWPHFRANIAINPVSAHGTPSSKNAPDHTRMRATRFRGFNKLWFDNLLINFRAHHEGCEIGGSSWNPVWSHFRAITNKAYDDRQTQNTPLNPHNPKLNKCTRTHTHACVAPHGAPNNLVDNRLINFRANHEQCVR